MKQWLDSPYYTTAQTAVPEVIEAEVDLSQIKPLVEAFTSLYLLGIAEGALGCVRVAEGDPAGWNHLRASTLASAWHLALLARLFYRGHLENGFIAQNVAGLTLAQAIALREDAVAHWLGGVLVEGLVGPAPFADWRMNPFEPFITKLYARWRGGDVDLDRAGVHPLGVYQRVFDSWEQEAPLLEIADYHCERTDDRGQGAPPEFASDPCCAFPAEIIALCRVRAELRLPTPPIEHPLLASPLATVPDPLPPMTQPYHLRLREKTEAYLTALGTARQLDSASLCQNLLDLR